MTYEPDFVEQDRLKFEKLWDTPLADWSDTDYLAMCIAHGVSWPGAGLRPYAFMRPSWMPKKKVPEPTGRTLSDMGLQLLCAASGHK